MEYELNIATKVPGSDKRPFGPRYTHFARVVLGAAHDEKTARADATVLICALRHFAKRLDPDHYSFMLSARNAPSGVILDRYETAPVEVEVLEPAK